MPRTNLRPSDKLSKKAKFLNQQSDMFRADILRADIQRIRDLSPEQRRRLVLAAPAFVSGEGSSK